MIMTLASPWSFLLCSDPTFGAILLLDTTDCLSIEVNQKDPIAYIRDNVVTVLRTCSNDPVLGLPFGILNEESKNGVFGDTGGRSPCFYDISLVILLDDELRTETIRFDAEKGVYMVQLDLNIHGRDLLTQVKRKLVWGANCDLRWGNGRRNGCRQRK